MSVSCNHHSHTMWLKQALTGHHTLDIFTRRPYRRTGTPFKTFKPRTDGTVPTSRSVAISSRGPVHGRPLPFLQPRESGILLGICWLVPGMMIRRNSRTGTRPHGPKHTTAHLPCRWSKLNKPRKRMKGGNKERRRRVPHPPMYCSRSSVNLAHGTR
jgi:hypothetical protein